MKLSLGLLLLGIIGPSLMQNTNSIDKVLTAGRIERNASEIVLIGSASSAALDFNGESVAIAMESRDGYSHHNYVVLELDGQYLRRMKIEAGPAKWYTIPTAVAKHHHLVIYKATEAANGAVALTGFPTNLLKPTATHGKKKIEFIGDSITCGMGNDSSEIPCGGGQWFDQHNAYWAYGPILARALDADFLLSSVSGIGMYRNWNDQHEQEAIMPDVYEKLYLSKDNPKPYDFEFAPDLITICLGTNDLSDGDGKKARLPFEEEKYVANYIAFVDMLYRHHPTAQLVLLNSPMVSGEKNETLLRCLHRVQAHFDQKTKYKSIAVFSFEPMRPKGCDYHPDIQDDKTMAAQLKPFFKKLLDEE